MTVIYADLAFFLNAVLDYLTLCCTVRLFGLPLRHRRIAAAAAAGGVYGVLALLPPWRFLTAVVCKCAVSALMVRIAFGKSGYFLRHYLLFLVASCTLSGAVVGLEAVFTQTDSPWVIFLLSGAFCAFALAVVFHRGAASAGRLVTAEIALGGRRTRVTLFCDTGNTLRDPISGQVLCIVWREALSPLLAGREVPYRTITYQSVGTAQAELPYFCCDSLTIGKKTWKNYPIGVTDHPLSDGGGFVGLWGGEQEGEGCNDRAMAAKTT